MAAVLPSPDARRTRDVDAVKRSWAHYTPPELAELLARAALRLAPSGALHVLDPACGDGALLEAVARAAPRRALRLRGIDTDADAVEAARRRLAACDDERVDRALWQADFLEEIGRQPPLLGDDAAVAAGSPLEGSFDVVIANPPYVRTQVLGSAAARALAGRFGLSGRVDLYQAFVVGMAAALREGGVLALLCSNRFMTTRGGADLRRLLATTFRIEHLYDLGDTKLFPAAVLPAIVVARKARPGSRRFTVTSIYEASSSARPTQPGAQFPTVVEALQRGEPGAVEIAGKTFSLRRGAVEPVAWRQPWVAPSDEGSELLDRLAASTWRRFKDVGQVRVGIKTTCDKVFIRSDWDELPDDARPEGAVLLPLLTHHVARRWLAGPARRSVLYPYDLAHERRTPLDLAGLPGARAYLERHRELLASRRYVIEAGRQWWEIWVPQRPARWRHPKIVFPDISDEPRFWLDTTGAVVNGDCYWLSLPPDAPDELARVVLAVANSSLATRFYDHACGNRLYAGRRRYITQYVEAFPLPDPDRPETHKVAKAVAALLASPDDRRGDLEAEVDDLVWRAFGLEEPRR